MNRLNEAVAAGRLNLGSRLVMPPMATAKSSENGMVTKELCDYYDEKSKGGYFGLIITEHSYICPEGKASAGQLSVAEDSAIDGLKRLTRVIHQNGSKVMAQLNHAGGNTSLAITGHPPLSASATAFFQAKNDGVPPREMDENDIQKVIDAFCAASLRAKAAGFDGVEIHAAHGYLLNQFFSPLINHREDRYSGKTPEGRTRLILEILQAVRRAVGEDFPLAVRLGACDYTPGGTTIADSVWAAAAFEKAGIDLLDISGGMCGWRNPLSSEPGYFSETTEAIKKKVSTPVILTGGITDAAEANDLLAAGKADLIGVGRAVLNDSLWAKKAFSAQ